MNLDRGDRGDLSKEIRTEGGIRPTGSVTIRARAHLWIWWAQIAIDQERIAAQARSVSLSFGEERTEEFDKSFVRETRASMIAIAAVSHALDALFGVVKETVRSKSPSAPRWSEILETLKAAFEIRGHAGGGGWAAEFDWLFDARDAAVHHSETTEETVPHPTGTNASPIHLLYSVESAGRAVSLLLEVLQTCVDHPRAPLEDWARDSRRAVANLVARRA